MAKLFLHWSVSSLSTVVQMTGISRSPDSSSLLAGIYTMKVRYTKLTELSTATAKHRQREQQTTFSGPCMCSLLSGIYFCIDKTSANISYSRLCLEFSPETEARMFNLISLRCNVPTGQRKGLLGLHISFPSGLVQPTDIPGTCPSLQGIILGHLVPTTVGILMQDGGQSRVAAKHHSHAF